MTYNGDRLVAKRCHLHQPWWAQHHLLNTEAQHRCMTFSALWLLQQCSSTDCDSALLQTPQPPSNQLQHDHPGCGLSAIAAVAHTCSFVSRFCTLLSSSMCCRRLRSFWLTVLLFSATVSEGRENMAQQCGRSQHTLVQERNHTSHGQLLHRLFFCSNGYPCFWLHCNMLTLSRPGSTLTHSLVIAPGCTQA